MIRFEHVTKSYGKNPILKDLNFEIPDGQFVVLIGPSGCGKTTTLKTINRLIDIDSGTISIDGKDIQSSDKVELRRHIGYVPYVSRRSCRCHRRLCRRCKGQAPRRQDISEVLTERIWKRWTKRWQCISATGFRMPWIRPEPLAYFPKLNNSYEIRE